MKLTEKDIGNEFMLYSPKGKGKRRFIGVFKLTGANNGVFTGEVMEIFLGHSGGFKKCKHEFLENGLEKCINGHKLEKIK